MSFHWLTWSNPVALWWGFLLAVSVVNVALWLLVDRHAQRRAWMSLYFSAAVWSSLALCGIMLVKDGLPRYLATSASLRLAERRSSARLAWGLSGSIPGT
jgi:hypothetical protein